MDATETAVDRIRELEGALQASEERYQTILDNIEDGYCEVGLRGKYLCVNDAYCRMFNRTREEVLGASYKQFFDAERGAKYREVFHSVYLTGEPAKELELEIDSGRCGADRFSKTRFAGRPGMLRNNRARLHRAKTSRAGTG